MTQVIPPATPRPWKAWIGLAAVLLGALLLYRPWQGRPFDILDFSEFLPLVNQHQGFLDRFAALVDYYAGQHGRLNILSYAALSAKWSLLGDNPALWQWARFLQMSAITVGAYWLLRRLRIDPAGAVCGAMLFVVADSASTAWVRLTMGEPLGLVLVLAAAIIASRYQTAERWRSGALSIAALLAAALLAKEMLVGCVPFVLALALTFHPDGWRRPAWTQRTRWLLGSSVILIGGALAAIWLVLLSVPADGFTSLYGEAAPSVRRLLRTFRRMALPANSFRPGLGALIFAPNLLFIALSIGGFASALTKSRTRLSAVVIATLAVALPLTGAIIYLPWPQYHDFYGLPFLFGQVALLGFGVTMLVRETPRFRWAVYGACLMLGLIAGSIAQRQSARVRARQALNAGLAEALFDYPAVDSIVVMVGGRADQAWQGTGATLRRYAMATRPGTDLPPGVEATCSDVEKGLGAAGLLIVNPGGGCPVPGIPVRTLVERFSYTSWRELRIVDDSVWSTLNLVNTDVNDEQRNVSEGIAQP